MSPCEQETVERRSANYAPSIWTHQFIQSQTSEYLDEKYVERAAKLKERVRGLLVQKEGTLLLDQLELVDVLQRLGLSHHFDHEIHEILSAFNQKHHNNDMSLYQASLLFRLLRQQGYPISQEIFKGFMKEGQFEERHREDPKGLLSLYEASYLSIEDEEILDSAKVFSTLHLNKYLNNGDDEKELPLHWRVQRVESRRFIDAYEKRLETKKTKNSCEVEEEEEEEIIILELAKLDFNMMQAIYLKELKEVSRWHEEIGLGEGMGMGSCTRSRVAEGFLWSVGFMDQPQYEYCRNIISKISELIAVIDDVYDVYATLHEAQILTDAITRWDVKAVEEEGLPTCVKVCLLALFNYVNLIAYDVLKQLGINVLPYLKKAWADIAKSYLVEAKWYHNEQKPSLDEYLENGLVSIGAPVVLIEAYIAMASVAATNKEMTTAKMLEDLEILVENPEIVRYSSIICRLCDDLGTSSDEMERGDIPKAVQCRMNDTACREDEAREFIRGLVEENWKKMNGCALVGGNSSHFPRDFVTTVLNLPRTCLLFYRHGDGYGRPEGTTKQHISSLFFRPFATALP
ncbi:hypothetical protein DM860_016330 [Cuscuta australis]|uniref:Uncharacterized protein n=1 Tax=Cuscuta australis TaxID=267555 RepID=A0A328E537_9ASTE|nr:hypothetical protein DM860_016330 [Cuscuta australis]